MDGSGRGVLLLLVLALTLPSEGIWWNQHLTGKPQVGVGGRQPAPGARSTSPVDSRNQPGGAWTSEVRSPSGYGPARPSVRGWGSREAEPVDYGCYEEYAEAGGWVDGEAGEEGAEQYDGQYEGEYQEGGGYAEGYYAEDGSWVEDGGEWRCGRPPHPGLLVRGNFRKAD